MWQPKINSVGCRKYSWFAEWIIANYYYYVNENEDEDEETQKGN